MKNFIVHLVVSALLLVLVAYFVPGIHVTGFFIALLAALVFGVVNGIVRPVLILLTLPITVVTLGLFLFVVNALMLMFTAWLVPGFTVAGLGSALVGSILLTLFNLVADALLGKNGVRDS
jgi:putative membrane protein